jgi:lincosamide nucleotidyltransferase A/C/D/E
MMLSAVAAAELYTHLRRSGVRCWVMGGWAVDALLGRQSRDHHDLDVLVLVDDLGNLRRLLAERGFVTTRIWNENRWLDGDSERWPTAFVAQNQGGVELDIHVIEMGEGGAALPLCDVPWPFDADSLEGRGTIAGTSVACVSAQTQLAMHDGYELPEAHQRDVELRRSLR